MARQRELSEARKQASQDARQSTKIEELERRLRRAGEEGRPPTSARPVAPAPAPTGEAAADPVSGSWRGSAVIQYEDGESAPFLQRIEIGTLRVGQVSGLSEAQQGSTTCHGPLTYEGVRGGAYVFWSEEQNVAECIDESHLELSVNADGTMNYREVTEVSVSSGTLTLVP